jgi:hypothetical protein
MSKALVTGGAGFIMNLPPHPEMILDQRSFQRQYKLLSHQKTFF